MNSIDSDIRSRYLALALDARRILDALVPFAESGQRNELLDTAVKEAVNALTSVTEGTGINTVHSNLAFDEYEQVLTLDEIKGREDRKTVISDLKSIAAPNGGDAQQAATRVLEFFFAVESRALQYYNRPPAIASYTA